MKRSILIITLLIAAVTVLPVCAQELNETMIGVVSDNLDNLFPIRSIDEQFNTNQPSAYSDLGVNTAIESNTKNGSRNILIYANPDGETEYSVIEKINSGNLKNFLRFDGYYAE